MVMVPLPAASSNTVPAAVGAAAVQVVPKRLPLLVLGGVPVGENPSVLLNEARVVTESRQRSSIASKKPVRVDADAVATSRPEGTVTTGGLQGGEEEFE